MVVCGDSIITKIQCFCIFYFIEEQTHSVEKWGNSKSVWLEKNSDKEYYVLE